MSRLRCKACKHVWGAYEDTCHCDGPCHNREACKGVESPYPVNVGTWGADEIQLPYCAKCDWSPSKEGVLDGLVELSDLTHCDLCGKRLMQPCDPCVVRWDNKLKRWRS